MAHDRITLPSSGGGVLRYSDSSKSKLEFSPYVVVGFAVAVIIIELILRAGG
ncbi:preprotein translocase subunit Sec61beta [Candidatus Woesearchaeota archaeon]|nr:preprotein translocase subunit Sec61beta [Candidatus Woesearchaeota archaeon]